MDDQDEPALALGRRRPRRVPYATFPGAGADARLQRLRDWLDSRQDRVIIAVCLLLGFWLAGKSIYLLVSRP